jgi:hypothetical protein
MLELGKLAFVLCCTDEFVSRSVLPWMCQIPPSGEGPDRVLRCLVANWAFVKESPRSDPPRNGKQLSTRWASMREEKKGRARKWSIKI